MDWLKIFEIGKVPMRINLLTCVVAGSLLFLPKIYLDHLQLTAFIKDYGKYAGIVFLVSSALLIISFFGWIFRQVMNWFNGFRYKTRVTESLVNLDGQEKAILREFIFSDSTSLPLPFQNASVASLIDKGIIYQVSAYGAMNHGELTFNFAIRSVARKRLSLTHLGAPDKLPADYNDEDKAWLQNNRPDFIKHRFSW